MSDILTDRHRQFPNPRANWQLGQSVGASVTFCSQIQYMPLPNFVSDLDQSLSGAWLDCGRDFQKQIIEFGGAAKVRMTILVVYEPVNPMENKQPFEQYLSATPTRIFMREGTVTATENTEMDSLQILTDRISKFNSKFIREKSGQRLARVLKFILKMVKYAPLEERVWQTLQQFIEEKKTIINIKNDDERCFGYAFFYFLENANLPERHCYRASVHKDDMFRRHHLDTLLYSISWNDVYLYEDQLQININLFFFFDDEGLARHPLVIRRKNYVREANLLY